MDDCTLQLSHNGAYLDLEATLAEQRDELEGFQDDAGRGKKHSIILRTQLSVRVHACIALVWSCGWCILFALSLDIMVAKLTVSWLFFSLVASGALSHHISYFLFFDARIL
ncbi:hypothetical protein H8959_002139 [Pygathrix nigripes]